MKRRTRWFLVGTAIVIPLALVALIVVNVIWGIDDAYAKWGAADMVIDYMRTHEGRWPPNWEALRHEFDEGGGRVGDWSFEHYQSRLNIDFDADPAALRRQSLEADCPTFNVISARWTMLDWGGGPNEILYRYFRRKPVEGPGRNSPPLPHAALPPPAPQPSAK
jgi:hypothetical protein